MDKFVEVTIERNGETQTVRIEKQRYEQIHKQAVAAFRASIVPFDGKPYTTEIISLDKVLTDEIELAVGYQIAEKLLAEAEPVETEEGEL
ncbi:MAG: hypothetical protein ACLP56_02555 [Candidatus Sulfotelmatobacter sp.]